MPKEEVKISPAMVIIPVGLGIAGIVGLAALAQAAPPEEGAASIKIQIFDAKGKPVPKNSPADLYEGETYTIGVSITNQSTKAGVPCAAVLTLSNESTVDGIGVTPSASRSDNYGPNEPRTFTYTMAVPDGTAGAYGVIYFYIDDPLGNRLATAHENINILAHVLSAVISPGMIYNTDLPDWVDITSGMEIAYGLDNHIAPEWINHSDIPIAGHVTLGVAYPDGTRIILAAVENQDAVADPLNGWIVRFEPFNANQEGTYSLHAEIWSDGQRLDSVDFTLVAVVAIVYGATIVIEV